MPVLQQFLNELFEASPNYSLPFALQKLRAFGGISSILNCLNIDHRQIGQVYKNDTHSFLSNRQKSHKPMKPQRSRQVRQSQLQYFLLYLVTLSFSIKMLLYQNSIRDRLDIISETISFVFLVFIIIEKKARGKDKNSQLQEKHKNSEEVVYKIRRKGYELEARAKDVEQGDIVLIEEGEVIKFDGIVLQVIRPMRGNEQKQGFYLSVNEEEIGTGRNKSKKAAIWRLQNHQPNNDPFVLFNSKILGGSAWILVCLVRQIHDSVNNREIQLAGILKLSSLNITIRKIIYSIVSFLVLYLSVGWISIKIMNSYEILLHLIYLLSCVAIYLSYINTGQLLSNIAKCLKMKIRGKGYHIFNHKLFQKLVDIDLVIIEDNCLTRHIELLTKINNRVQLKIVVSGDRKLLQTRIGGDLNQQMVFYPLEEIDLRDCLQKLKRSKFICCNYQSFRSYYLQLLQQLQYNIIYASKSRAAFGKYEQIVTIKCSNIDGLVEDRLQGEWIRIESGTTVEDVIIDLMEKAQIYRRFSQSFYTVIINNCLEITMLIVWALNGCLVDLNLNLLVIFTNRNRVKQFYQALSKDIQHQTPKLINHKIFSLPFEANFILGIYYLYMNWQIYQSQNRQFQLFLLLMGNRMFRIQTLLKDTNTKQLLTRLLKKSCILIILIIAEALFRWQMGKTSDFISESMDILLLPMIILLLALFL